MSGDGRRLYFGRKHALDDPGDIFVSSRAPRQAIHRDFPLFNLKVALEAPMKSMDLCRLLAGRTLLSTCLIAVAGAAMAQSSLTDADLKTLVVGKTVDFKSLVNGRTGAGYFAPDGRYTLRLDNGKTIDAEWSIGADGTLCINGLAQVCGPVSRGADGVYTRFTHDKPTAVFTKITPGKTF